MKIVYKKIKVIEKDISGITFLSKKKRFALMWAWSQDGWKWGDEDEREKFIKLRIENDKKRKDVYFSIGKLGINITYGEHDCYRRI